MYDVAGSTTPTPPAPSPPPRPRPETPAERRRPAGGDVADGGQARRGGVAHMPLPRPHHRDRGGHGPPPRRRRVLQQGRLHRGDMGRVAADEVRAEEGPRRGQPRAARRRVQGGRENDGHYWEDDPGDRLVPLAPAYHCPAFPCRCANPGYVSVARSRFCWIDIFLF